MSLLVLLSFQLGTSFRFVVTNNAAARCSQKPMVSGIMASDAADQCAFNATFCAGRRNSCQSKDNRCTSDKSFHSDLQTFSIDDYSSITRCWAKAKAGSLRRVDHRQNRVSASRIAQTARLATDILAQNAPALTQGTPLVRFSWRGALAPPTAGTRIRRAARPADIVAQMAGADSADAASAFFATAGRAPPRAIIERTTATRQAVIVYGLQAGGRWVEGTLSKTETLLNVKNNGGKAVVSRRSPGGGAAADLLTQALGLGFWRQCRYLGDYATTFAFPTYNPLHRAMPAPSGR
jgi:hypothetical protein